MYKTIVVPLDTSVLAEAAITYVRRLVAPQVTHLVLVHSIEPQEYRYGTAPAQSHTYAELLEGVEPVTVDYFSALRNKLQEEGYSVTVHLAKGNAAQLIVDVAVQEQADLIAMTTHGRTGFRRWVLGSIAEQVLKTAHQPVLLVRSTVAASNPPHPTRLLLPLDGSPLAESVLPQAQSIALDTGATVLMAQVIQPSTEVGTRDGLSITQPSEQVSTAQHYLQTMAEQLRQAGVKVETHLYCGKPAEAILKAASDEAIDLIVMSTHGYSGFTKWVYGSVANEVLHKALCPLLLNRAFPKAVTRIDALSAEELSA